MTNDEIRMTLRQAQGRLLKSEIRMTKREILTTEAFVSSFELQSFVIDSNFEFRHSNFYSPCLRGESSMVNHAFPGLIAVLFPTEFS